MANEMAHYAADCWDAEIETSYGWIECVGCFLNSGPNAFLSIAGTLRLTIRGSLSACRTTILFKQLQEQQAATIKAAGQEFQVPSSVFTITPTEIKEQGTHRMRAR
jgi:glycyl-tRNA synthetase